MNRKLILGVLVVACFAFFMLTKTTGAYSDWVGVYARIDKVILEPSDAAPVRIQIWGAFAIASKENRNDYQPAERGYLYYSVKPGQEEVCRREWADLKRLAGSESIVGFGVRNQPGRLRKAEDKPADPDVYPTGMGLVKIYDRGTDYEPIRDLRAFPKR
jgi:hypothetical protein